MRSFERTRDKRDRYVGVLCDDRSRDRRIHRTLYGSSSPADELMLQYIRAVASIVR